MLGKLEAERGERSRADTNEPPKRNTGFLQQCLPATRGSLGVDVETTVDVTLVDSNVQKVPSNVIGPLVHQESNVGGLLLGRSSAGIQGLIVLPGVIDADYTGRIYIMVYTVCPPVFIPKEPFRTCLLGVPGFKATDFSSFATKNCSRATNVSGCSATLINSLNVTLPWDPQELSLLGSMRIGNKTKNWTQTCFIFGGPAFTGTNYYRTSNWIEWTNVTSKERRYNDYYDPAGYCGDQAALGAETKGGVPIWNNGTPKALPPDVFLICGDRAWQGVPQNVFGGPCYLGKLTLLAPDQNWWKDVRNKTIEIKHRTKREITGLSPDCDDELALLSTTERVFLSLFIPGGAAGRALKQVGQLACWAKKQAKVTTQVIETLLEDQNSLRHAILQNRAAIDFLLLAQGHGCEDFEGMCCMNLSDHSESIHKQLRWLKEHANKIRQNQGFFDEWLTSLFGSLPSWLKGLLAEGLRLLIILVIIGLCFCVACSCVKKAFRTMINHAWIAQKQEGGIVEEWLSEKGHSLIDVSNPAFDGAWEPEIKVKFP
ncbi:hypothetical protein QYF61_024345 [Mycteria americana]|uniref:dUTPase-like domain-containing protein n=1 Tax=Mycteria americana TaxID=33587 RepID=A0AAN7MIP7_MYCAM|nr:hypothetical protein QYF61_024345 [Mycteria americana]